MRQIMKIAVAATALLMPAAGSAQATETTVRIAYLTDLSGPGAYWGTRSATGARMAADELSENGIKIEIVTGDHRLDTKTAVSAAQKVTMADKVDALVVEFAPTAIAASPVARKTKTIFINASAATSLLKSNPYAFTGYVDYRSGCAMIAARWKAQSLKRIGVLKPVAEFAELCLQGVRSIFPGATVQEHSFNEPVLTQVTRMKHQGVQAILSPALEGDMINLLKAMETLKYLVPVAGTKQDSFTDKVVYHYGHMLDGALSFGLPPVSVAFIKRIRAYRPDLELRNLEAVAYGYFYTMKLARALIRCGNSNLECQMKSISAREDDQILPFAGSINRRASYRYLIEEWYGAYSFPLEETDLQIAAVAPHTGNS